MCVSSKGRIYKELWELRWSIHLFDLGNTGHNFREAERELDIEEGNVLLMEAFLRKGWYEYWMRLRKPSENFRFSSLVWTVF